MNEEFKELACAVVGRAVKDWQLLCKQNKEKIQTNGYVVDFNELLNFFVNDKLGWLAMAEVDNMAILKMLMEIEGSPSYDEPVVKRYLNKI